MSEKRSDSFDSVLEQGRSIVQRGNTRHIIVRNSQGEVLFDVTATVAVVIAVMLLFFGPAGLFLTLLAVGAGIVTKVRVEVVRDLDAGDDTVVIEKDEDKAEATRDESIA